MFLWIKCQESPFATNVLGLLLTGVTMLEEGLATPFYIQIWRQWVEED